MDSEMMPTEMLEHSNDKYRNNPKLENIHRQSDFYKQVRDSIAKEGILNPIIVKTEMLNGKYKISIGNNRYLAAKELGIKEVSVHVGDYDRHELKRIPHEKYEVVNYG
jgi:ParB-like chromosome segregation protein Spo0J